MQAACSCEECVCVLVRLPATVTHKNRSTAYIHASRHTRQTHVAIPNTSPSLFAPVPHHKHTHQKPGVFFLNPSRSPGSTHPTPRTGRPPRRRRRPMTHAPAHTHESNVS